jgi:hypothetical protein
MFPSLTVDNPVIVGSLFIALYKRGSLSYL